MRCLMAVIMCVGWVFACSVPNSEVVAAGNGRLVRWSEQRVDSAKKVVFLPGHVVTADPHGLKPGELMSYFSPKLENLNMLGTELFGAPTSELVEFWMYGYQSQQDIAKIAADFAAAIAANSHFDNSLVAGVGHSQGGVVLWLMDQRYNMITGGVLLGAPILSTPLVHEQVRDEAVRAVFPVASQVGLLDVCKDAAEGTAQLQIAYPETGAPRTKLKFFVGYIEPHPATIIQRNVDLLDALVAGGGNFLSGLRNDRQLLELGAVIIGAAEWGGGSQQDQLSDGAVPISSAIAGVGSAPMSLWEEYDHQDLLSGKGDLELDRETLKWLGEVLQLYPQWVETDLPGTPNRIELDLSARSALDWAKFAYVQDGNLYTTDEDWRRQFRMPIAGVHSWPQFGSADGFLTWAIEYEGLSNVYVWKGQWAELVSFDGKSRYASFSPNGQWLAYQSKANLVVHELQSNQRYRVAQDVDLVAPPVWTVEGLMGKLYFASRNPTGQINLYSVSPRSRDKQLTEVNLVMADSGQPFLVQGPLSGIIAISSQFDGSGQIVSQRVVVVSGLAAAHLSVEIRFSDEQTAAYNEYGREFLIELDYPFGFSSAAFDVEYGHLYLVDTEGSQPGVYLFDINGFLNADDETQLDDIFYLVMEGARQLDIKAPTN